jgi:hypothetical protein
MEAIHGLRLLLKTYPLQDRADNPAYQIVAAAIKELEDYTLLEFELLAVIAAAQRGNDDIDDRVISMERLIRKRG